MSLTGKQRRYLRGLAHHIDPVLMVGQSGVTPSVLEKTDFELENHELIKVRVLEGAPVKAKPSGAELAAGTRSELIQVIGRMAVLYRPRSKKPTIRLPKESAESE
jgi:RNA-binding protein